MRWQPFSYSRSRLRELSHRYSTPAMSLSKEQAYENMTPFRLTHNEQPNQATETEPIQSIY